MPDPDTNIPTPIERRISCDAVIARELAESIRSAMLHMPDGKEFEDIVEELTRAARRAIDVPIVQRSLMEIYHPVPADYLGAHRPPLNGNAPGGAA